MKWFLMFFVVVASASVATAQVIEPAPPLLAEVPLTPLMGLAVEVAPLAIAGGCAGGGCSTAARGTESHAGARAGVRKFGWRLRARRSNHGNLFSRLRRSAH